MSWWEFRGFWGDFAKVSIRLKNIGNLKKSSRRQEYLPSAAFFAKVSGRLKRFQTASCCVYGGFNFAGLRFQTASTPVSASKRRRSSQQRLRNGRRIGRSRRCSAAPAKYRHRLYQPVGRLGVGGEIGIVQRTVGKGEPFDAVCGAGKVIVDAHHIAVPSEQSQMIALSAPRSVTAVQTGEVQAVVAAVVAYPVGAVSCGKTVGVVAGAAVEPVVACAALKGIVAA